MRNKKAVLLLSAIVLLAVFSKVTDVLLVKYRKFQAREDLIASYAGCEIKHFNLAGLDGIDNVNKSWKKDSEQYSFSYEDVANYIKEYCFPWDDTRIERTYPNEYIVKIKRARDYQLDFLNRKIDVLKQ